MSQSHSGRHEHGQNFLTDRTVIAAVVDVVAPTSGPIVEVGAGDGALTLPMERLGRPVTAIEIDPRRAAQLAAKTAPHTTVITADFLRYRLPRSRHVIVGSLPFHLTTAMLRRILRAPGWTSAALIVQWEVARRRAAVGGATMMTAQWWPWFEFALVRRIPATAFRPMPNVDAGLITITRRDRALVDEHDRRRYQALVHRVFTGRGRGIGQIVGGCLSRAAARQWLRENGVRTSALPRDLTAAQWVALFAAHAN